MNKTIVSVRNKMIRAAYAHILKPIFFKFDAEYIHDRVVRVGIFLGRHRWGRRLAGCMFEYRDTKLQQEILGIRFRNPIGLSAGFDKNAELTDILPSVGFGFVEAGSVTGEPCLGNPKPRLWRLPKARSLVVHYGLKNQGCEAISDRLHGKHHAIPLGISVAMTNCADNLILDSAIRDYVKAFRTLERLSDYVTVNISCPNTQGGQPFTDPQQFDRLFDALDAIETTKPVFVKLSPDMSDANIDTLLASIHNHRIHGIITTNLTKKRQKVATADSTVPRVGGMSGKSVQDMSDRMLAYIYKKEGRRYVLIGNGGVFTAEDAYRKIRLGASLVQLITGMIFEGPQVISEINLGLARLLERDGFKNVSDAIGVDTC